MPKMKTHKGAAARFKVTGGGKLRRGQQNAAHYRVSKTSRHKRRVDAEVSVHPADAPRISRLLGRR